MTGGQGGWVARIWADRDYHELVLARTGTTVGPFPADAADREVPLVGDEVRIGRDGAGGAIALADPGVSALHAVLMAVPPDRWVVLDPGSTNGTSVNYGEDSLPTERPVPLRSGDRIHVGAWTTITVERRSDG